MTYPKTKISMSLLPRPPSWRRQGPDASSRHRQGASRLLDDNLECFWLMNREFGENLAIDFDTRFREAIDEARIGEAVLAHRRVETLNPQSAEDPLLGAAVARRILHRTIDRRLRRPDRILAAAVKALGGRQCLLVFGVRGNAALYASHE